MDSGKHDIATSLVPLIPHLGKQLVWASPCIQINRTLRHPWVSLTTGSVTLPDVVLPSINVTWAHSVSSHIVHAAKLSHPRKTVIYYVLVDLNKYLLRYNVIIYFFGGHTLSLFDHISLSASCVILMVFYVKCTVTCKIACELSDPFIIR